MSKCFECGHEKSNSPTGGWCNNCGLQNPCPCWKGDHSACKAHMVKVRKETGYKAPVLGCCCGHKEDGE